ncbi:MAG: F0F1-type ATP synthase assembly protein I [Francisellaceae bacterium]|jgi:F0F1-type ATP synthase assembly protein I
MLTSKKLQLTKFLIFQIIVIFVSAMITVCISKSSVQSFISGAVVMFIGNLVLLSRFMLKNKTYQPAKELMILYACTFFKMMIIIVGTILVALYLHPSFIIYLGGLFLLQVAVWMMPLFIK